MTATQRAIAKARTRLLLQAALVWAGRLALAGLAADLIVLLLDRSALLHYRIVWWHYLLPLGPALAGGLVIAWAGRRGEAAVAAIIDRRMNLKDRLGTALYARGRKGEAFAPWVIADAEQKAQQLALAREFPVKPTALWGWLLPAAALLALLVSFLPGDLWGLERQKQQRLAAAEKQQDQARQVARRQTDAADAAVHILDGLEQAGVPLAPQEKLDKAELAELTRQRLTDPAGVRDAAAKVTQLSQHLADKADRAAANFEPLQRAIMRLPAPGPGPADAFAQALRSGDYAKAAKAIQDLAQQAQNLPPDQREALRQQLAAMADQLAGAAKQNRGAAAQAQQALQNAGASAEQARKLARELASGQLSSSQLQQQLQQQGMSPQQAQQLAQQLEQGQQNPQNQQQHQGDADQQCSSLSHALDKMSQALGSAPTSQPYGQNEPPSSQAQGTEQGNAAGQQLQGAADAAGQQLQQLAQMQQALKQLQESSAQMQQALDGMLANNAPDQSKEGKSGGEQFADGDPGRGAGDQPGGNPLGQARNPLPNAMSTPVSDTRDRGIQGRVITSWLGPDGKMAKNAPGVSFDTAVTKAKADAEQAVTEDRVPYPYHRAILDYFNQMPRQPDQAVAPPAAPH
jgi:hypothetical protein